MHISKDKIKICQISKAQMIECRPLMSADQYKLVLLLVLSGSK